MLTLFSLNLISIPSLVSTFSLTVTEIDLLVTLLDDNVILPVPDTEELTVIV